MSNIRVKRALERIDEEVNAVAKQVALYSGVDKKDALDVDRLCSDIAETASQIAAIAREVAGNKSSDKLVRNVRRALGYTSP